MKKRKYLNWTENEVDYLKESYYEESQKVIIENLRQRKWGSICKKAEKLNLKRKKIKKNELNILLNESFESYYWIGFLIADGCFEDRRISIAVSKKDLNHLLKLKKYVNSTNIISEAERDYFRMRLGDKSAVDVLKRKFKIKSNKTNFPCCFKSVNDEKLLFCLIIGFIDGDGCLNKNKYCNHYTLSAVGHYSWLDNFIFMFNFLFDYFKIDKTNKKPYIKNVKVTLPQNSFKTSHKLCTFSITNKELIKSIKNEIDALNLPYLKRKLGKIDYSP